MGISTTFFVGISVNIKHTDKKEKVRNCNHNIDTTNRFCPKCGEKVWTIRDSFEFADSNLNTPEFEGFIFDGDWDNYAVLGANDGKHTIFYVGDFFDGDCKDTDIIPLTNEQELRNRARKLVAPFGPDLIAKVEAAPYGARILYT